MTSEQPPLVPFAPEVDVALREVLRLAVGSDEDLRQAANVARDLAEQMSGRNSPGLLLTAAQPEDRAVGEVWCSLTAAVRRFGKSSAKEGPLEADVSVGRKSLVPLIGRYLHYKELQIDEAREVGKLVLEGAQEDFRRNANPETLEALETAENDLVLLNLPSRELAEAILEGPTEQEAVLVRLTQTWHENADDRIRTAIDPEPFGPLGR